MASALTNRVIWQSREALAQIHPDMSETEREILWVESHYGSDLAKRVAEKLAVRSYG